MVVRKSKDEGVERIFLLKLILDKFKKFGKTDLGIFVICYWQVILVAINTYQIANHKFVGVVFFGFLISFFWSINVNAVVFSSIRQRIIYALGGACGCLTGTLISYFWYS